LRFIRRTKAASLPSTASARATAASLALFTSRPSRSWRTVSRSPSRSRSDSSPTRGGPEPMTTTRRSSSRSRVSSAVITLVVDAMALATPLFRSNSTCPVDSSASMAALAATRGPATTPCPATGTPCPASGTPCAGLPAAPRSPALLPGRAPVPRAPAGMAPETAPEAAGSAAASTMTTVTARRRRAGRAGLPGEVIWGFIDMLPGG
jgi:hypothetical protein